MEHYLLGVNDTEGRYEVGDDHESEEDQDEEVEVGGQQGEDKTPGTCGMLQSNTLMDWSQTSYLSQIIFVEKNLSCGEISDFCKEFKQFMEFYRNLCRFLFEICVQKNLWRKSVWLKNDKYEVCIW